MFCIIKLKSYKRDGVQEIFPISDDVQLVVKGGPDESDCGCN